MTRMGPAWCKIGSRAAWAPSMPPLKMEGRTAARPNSHISRTLEIVDRHALVDPALHACHRFGDGLGHVRDTEAVCNGDELVLHVIPSGVEGASPEHLKPIDLREGRDATAG